MLYKLKRTDLSVIEKYYVGKTKRRTHFYIDHEVFRPFTKELFPDDDINSVTSKNHNNDEKHPTCGAHISINFWDCFK